MVRVHYTENVARFQVDGTIDDEVAQDIKLHFKRLNLDEIENVIFDFSGVTFIGSAGIGKLLLCYRDVALKNGKIIIEGASPRIKELFKSMNLDKVFLFY